MRKIYSFLFILFCCALYAQDEYTEGVFFVNEDWYGHQNSTVNFLSNNGEWTYRVFQKNNPGKELGCTTQYGTIYGGKFYFVSKQERDPGASVTGSRFAVCDAKTMKCIKEFQTIATDSNGKSIADGRSFLGVNEKKGYIGTSNGIWVYDIENMERGNQIPGTGNPNSSGYGQLYYAQIGTMVRTADYVIAIHQQDGLKVIDAEADTLIKTIAPPKYIDKNETKSRGFGSIVQSKDGNLWISMALNTLGMGGTLPYILKMNPYTLEVDTLQIPSDLGIEDIPNSWYAWTADGFCASTKENKIYWNGNNGNSWFKGRRIFCYDIDKNEFLKIYDFEDMPGNWILYGTGFRIHPVTDEIYCSIFHEFQDPTYETVRISNKGQLLQEYPMIVNYWFPAMPVFPDNSDPVVSDIPVMDCKKNSTTIIPLDEYATDEDNMQCAIIKKVISNTTTNLFDAYILNGNLNIISFDDQEGEGDIVVRFNSNGKTIDKTITIKISTEGNSISSEQNIQKIYVSHNKTIVINNCAGYQFSIYNINGVKVKNILIENDSYNETIELPQGIYILQGNNGTDSITKKIIIQ
jgi:hypothetical protein